ncbi:PD40 domain-containing protein [Pseudanabaena sp. FACHB-1998]|uniref:WD40 repeat domain-containing protein n=1 Tax=Pseudanabaena sp. FACHB-1998 TaxID=2692858 RepID=UPI00168165F4|nr:PD40 domain-containing protein [Pseudanabaena sp. FACHB-1998]MBD2178883.1 PD40 domain-containing protein [Pseudanabaena sp. FACHB-1998]
MGNTSNQASENISSDNKELLQELSMTLELYEDEFKLLLARCNYQDLRDRLITHLKEIHPQAIYEIKLPRSQKDLYSYIMAQVRSETPKVLSIVGLNELEDLHAALLDINLNREMFRNNCPYPIIWWISDSTHKRIIRTAPDFESWTTTLEFPIDTDELLTSLHDGSEALFSHVLEPSKIPFFKKLGEIDQLGSLQCSELEIALKDLSDRGLNIEPKLQANLNFIRGLDALPPSSSPKKALEYLQASLTYWQLVADFERSGLLLNQIGELNYQITDAEKNRPPEWNIARSAFQASIEFFEKANRPDLLADVILRLVMTAKRMDDWDAMESLVQKALPLHLEFHNAYHLALDHRYLAEIAIRKQDWESARTQAKMALSFLTQVPEANQEWRNLYLSTIAETEIRLGNDREGLQLLLEARELGDTGHPKVNIAFLIELRSLYTRQKQYLEAFVTKQEQFAIEQQYGYRAFIGAGRLQGKKSVGKSQTDVATEIEASGRKHDLDELITRIAKPSYKMIVLYGKSGVGKSSLVNAGLIPKLEHTSFEGRDVCAIAMRVYTNWEEELEKALKPLTPQPPLPMESKALTPQPPLPWGKGETDSLSIDKESENEVLLPSPSGRGAGGEGIIAKLREKESQNFRLVLIFDQFEEFFFVYYNQPTERRRFFEFIGKLLNDSQNLSSLKVVLSLREDYLHYLLECNQIESMAAIDQDILSKNVLYRVGNLKVEAAKSLIQTLTQKSRFYLEPELIGAIADDLKDELGEVRPIELQVVGAQLQQEGIKTLEQYRLLGANPKATLVERYLNDVIVDCGEENQRLAKFLLFMMTDERGTRPLKTRVELEKDLHDLLTEMQGDTSALDLVLEIFVRSGLVVLIPESPLDRYQLVHDYLAEFIRASQAPEMAKLQQELMETRETLKQTVDRLSVAVKDEEAAKFKARGRSRLAFGVGIVASVMAVGAGIASFIALKSSVDSKFISDSYKMVSLLNGNLQLEALVEAVETGERLQKNAIVSPDTKIRVITSIQEVVYAMQEKNRLLGNNGFVTSISFSPDGKTIASGSSDNTIKLWSLEGKELQTFKGHSAIVWSVAFSPDGKTIASGSRDATIKLWNLEGKVLQTLKGHSGLVASVAFSPDGSTLATGSSDRTVKLWNLEGKELQTFKGHSDSVWSVTFSPDGKSIATGSDDRTVKLWNLEGKELQTFKGYSDSFPSLAFSPDGKMIATIGNNTVKLWNLEGRDLQIFKGQINDIWRIAFSPDGKAIITGDLNGGVKLWNLEGKEIQAFKGHSASIWSVAFSPNGKVIATGSFDRTVKLWNLEPKELPTIKGHSNGVSSIAFSPDGKIIATGSWDNIVKLWDLDGKEIQSLKGHSDKVNSVAFSPDGKTIASSSWDNTIKLWNLEGKEFQTFKGHNSGVNSVVFSADGKNIVTGSDDNTIKLWNLEGKELQTFKGHNSGVISVAFSPDGKKIASSSWDNTVKLWNLEGKELQTFKGHSNSVYGVTFSPDGKTIASSSSDNTIKLWNLEGKELQTFKGHSAVVWSVAFSPDGKKIASGSRDNTIKLWNLEGKELQTFKGHSSSINSVAFSPDGKTIATASADKKLKLWSLDLERQKGLGCYWLQDYIATNPDLRQKLATCRDPQILKAAAPALVAEARTKGMIGKPEVALSLFQEAKKLDSSIALDPQTEINPYFIPKGERLAREGDIKGAVVAYEEGIKRNPNIQVSADSWNTLCWNGSLYKSASQVIFACDNAVNLEPNNLFFYKNRIIAKALAGDRNGSIAEIESSLLKIYRENLEKMLSIRARDYVYQYTFSEHQGWLEELTEGKNPFTDEKLEEWRQQAKKDKDS